ncbi:uncharacterized protein LOC114544900 [Dendronephthya gigantea]|uniref:uncharacterized protein LOC114544900 n=1 Tax=Dendronephthya gigantea TaxID=151771 RepID=UPI00106C8A41|nr:uncharacterized protein LOC114544900 [Dendronephthya gigantea]
MSGKIHISLLLVLLASTTVFGCWGGRRRGSSSTSVADMRKKIAQKAESYVGSTRWCYSCSSGHGANTDKCNYFVYDVGREAGAKMPVRTFSWRGGPVGAGRGGWGTASSLDYWTRVSSPQRGDIVSAHSRGTYHVGIYVAYRTTVSANSHNVGKNCWPWGSYQSDYADHVYWRYTG